MSSSTKKSMENAEEIIEKFGGIRPMASKTNIPVTTIQGWKKRGQIPDTRRQEILNLAAKLNIELEAPKPVEKTIANENAPVQQVAEKKVASTSVPPSIAPVVRAQEKPSGNGRESFIALDNVLEDNLMDTINKKIRDAEKRAVMTSTAITVALIVLAVVAVAVLLWPSAPMQESERLAALEQVQEQDSAIEQSEPAQPNIQERAEVAMNEIADAAAESYQAGVDYVANSGAMQAMADKLAALKGTEMGQQQLEAASAELGALFTNIQGLNGQEQINAALESARGQSEALKQTFEGVPTEDLKAAAMLLAMTQMRESLNRQNAPFQDDYVLLKNLVGQDNQELAVALDKMAPYAESGVLTPEGLSAEFKSMTGEVLVASLKGEDVSIQDRAKARMNELFEVQKNGELITGTPTQATLVRTENLLAEGNIEAAIAEMQTLDGEAGQAAQAWVQMAQGTLNAQKIKVMLGQALKQVGYSPSKPYDFR